MNGTIKFITQYILVLLCVIASTISYAQQVVESKYYRHLMFRESPFSFYKGIHPISKETVNSVAHYKFDYDEKRRVIAISHQIGNQIISDNGNWDSFIWFAPKVTIEYNANGEIHRYFNVDNEQIATHGNVYNAIYTYNEHGVRSSLKFSDDKNQPSENGWHAHRYEWSTDEEQRIVEKRYSLNNKLVSIRPEFKFYETRLDYDDSGRLQFMYNFGLESKPTNNESGAGIDRIYYDHKGNFQRWQVFSKDKNPVAGNRPKVHVGEHLYDNFGNKIGLRGFDVDGQRMGFSWGDFSISSNYDSFANKTGSHSYNENGKLNVASKTDYSSDGLRKELFSIVNDQGHPISSPRLSGAAAIKFQYTSQSKKATKRIPLDESLMPITK
jgi:hypothetical protein